MQSALLRALTGDREAEALFDDAADIDAMLSFEAALAAAEVDSGLIGTDAAAAIAAAIETFSPDLPALERGMARDGVAVPELVRQLRRAVAAPHDSSVHMGATSQDAVDTGLTLRLSRLIPLLDARLGDLLTALQGLADRHGAQPLVAHTRMQRALPFTVIDKIAAWSAPLERHRAALADLSPRLLVIQLGGPVGARDGFDGKGEEVARRLADRLGLGVAPPWHSQRDRIVAFGSLLSALSGSLGKIGADVALLAQTEIGAVAIEGGGGSSSMPHKSNPVNAEALVGLARFNAGLCGALHQAMVHENERSGAAWTLEWLTLPQMAVATAASLRLALALAGQISFPAGHRP